MSTFDESQASNQKKRKVAIIGVSSLILVAMVVAVSVGVNHEYSKGSGGGEQVKTTTKSIEAVCQPTDYRETCISSLSAAAGNTSDPKQLIKKAFHIAMDQVNKALENSSTIKAAENDPRTAKALESCKEVMDYAMGDLQRSIDHMGNFDLSKLDDYVQDLKIWLSGAVTYQETCVDAFENTTGDAGEKMKKMLNTSQEMTSNALAMASEISTLIKTLEIPGMSRRLLTAEESTRREAGGKAASNKAGTSVPSWAEVGMRKLLQMPSVGIQADAVVAQDGSGKFKTIAEALALVPKKSNKTFVIHVKEGVYQEQVRVDRSQWNVMLVGDGPTKTKITGRLNFAEGTPTFKTATFAAIGDGFIAKDIGFENSAGAEKHQAVAILVQSDRAIFYNCQFDGYQDTLYAHSHRQFYRDCTISGTIDFVFGDAASVFQNCKIIVRKPMDNQQCIVTAQGRKDRREATAIVLQNCTIVGDTLYLPMKLTNKAYLGRPWKQFSRTIIMQSHIDDLIAPEGWLPWMGTFGLDTCFYTEYNNRGNGAGQLQRVKWAGVKQLTLDEANSYTPGLFIGGDTWIKPSGVPYVAGMVPV
ncbi:hypothetical protein Ancab_030610 [Ancistrocladus abbreviatus]